MLHCHLSLNYLSNVFDSRSKTPRDDNSFTSIRQHYVQEMNIASHVELCPRVARIKSLYLLGYVTRNLLGKLI